MGVLNILWKCTKAFFRGIVYTYVIYLPSLVVTELIMYHHVDSEHMFWGLYGPITVIFLFTGDNYRYGITFGVLHQ